MEKSPRTLGDVTIARLQVVATCNRRCWQCPQHKDGARVRTGRVLDADEVTALAHRLRPALRPNVTVAPYFMGEPLLDRAFESKVEALRRTLPRSYINIHTNCDFLTHDRAAALFEAGLNVIVANCYEPATYDRVTADLAEWLTPTTSVLEAKTRKERHSVIANRYWDGGAPFGGWNNRAGSVLGPRRRLRLPKMCTMPFRSFNVLADGDVILCCNDYEKRAVMGNVWRDTLDYVWNSAIVRFYRKMLFTRQRIGGICQWCDYYGGPFAYSVRRPE